MRRERNLRIAVPVLKIGLEAVDTTIKFMDPFGRFVMYALTQGPLTEMDLTEATCLAPWHVRRMLEEMARNELIELIGGGSDAVGQIRPGRLGTDAPQRMEQIDRFNQSCAYVLTDQLTGQPLPPKLPLLPEAPDAVVLPGDAPNWERNEEYDGPVPDDLLASLPTEGIGFVATSVEPGYVVNYVYKEQLLYTALKGLVQRPGSAPNGGPLPPPGQRLAPPTSANPSPQNGTNGPVRKVDIPLTRQNIGVAGKPFGVFGLPQLSTIGGAVSVGERQPASSSASPQGGVSPDRPHANQLRWNASIRYRS